MGNDMRSILYDRLNSGIYHFSKSSQSNSALQSKDQAYQGSWLSDNLPYIIAFTSLGLLAAGLHLRSRLMEDKQQDDEEYEKELSRLMRRRNLRSIATDARKLLDEREISKEEMLTMLQDLRSSVEELKQKMKIISPRTKKSHFLQLTNAYFKYTNFAPHRRFNKFSKYVITCDINNLRRILYSPGFYKFSQDLIRDKINDFILGIIRNPEFVKLLTDERFINQLLQNPQVANAIGNVTRASLQNPQIMQAVMANLAQHMNNNPQLRQQIFSAIIKHMNEQIRSGQVSPEVQSVIDAIAKSAYQEFQRDPGLLAQTGDAVLSYLWKNFSDVLTVGAPLGIGLWILYGMASDDFSIGSLFSFALAGMAIYGALRYFGVISPPQAGKPEQPAPPNKQEAPKQGPGEKDKQPGFPNVPPLTGKESVPKEKPPAGEWKVPPINQGGNQPTQPAPKQPTQPAPKQPAQPAQPSPQQPAQPAQPAQPPQQPAQPAQPAQPPQQPSQPAQPTPQQPAQPAQPSPDTSPPKIPGPSSIPPPIFDDGGHSVPVTPNSMSFANQYLQMASADQQANWWQNVPTVSNVKS